MPSKTTTRVINRNIVDPIDMESIRSSVRQLDNTLQNFTTIRSRFAGQGDNPDPRRDYNDEFGYPETERIDLADYWAQYQRNSVAKKVNDILPSHCWQMQPMVHENDDPDDVTPFERAFMDVGDKLMGESFYTGERGDPIWDYAARVDKNAGLGGYGALLIGIDGPEGENLEEPLELKAGPQAHRKLTFLRAFPEISATINAFEQDPTNPRFNLPTFYDLTFDDTRTPAVSADVSVRTSVGSKRVHWTRILHMTDPVVSNEIRHMPRMLPNYNRLLDLGKLYGGSAEMFFRGGLPGYSFETHPSLGGDVEIDADAMQDMMEKYQNTLQRFIATTGMSVNSLAPQVADPTSQINVQIEAICIELDCPKRIFVGSERGELASSQDSRHWNDVIIARRNNHLTPRMIVPLVNRFILLGLLPTPGEDGFRVTWPEIETLSPLEKADKALKITQSIIAYVAGDGVTVMPVPYFLTMVLGFSNQEANAITEVLTADDLEDHLKGKAVAAVVDPEADIELAGSVAGAVT